VIPFGSQRSLGQDLATHLLNEHDNGYMEVAQVRGAIAHDLHGAFAEWEAQAHGLTKCRNYLYSLSVNPDPRQGPLTREQYFEYIDRAEERLGLAGQPRAVVFHIKHGREHCHVVWSRVDVLEGKAVQMAFDHQKLMMVTREFARDHGIELPEGYFRNKDDPRKNRQQSLYEQHQQNATGLTKEERMAVITQAWRSSDSAKAFVRAFEQNGYILATGKRPYVVVDIYGEVNALPKLIDDRQVRTKDVRARLEREFPPESLPSVEEAKALAAQHRKAIEDFNKAQANSDQLDKLKASQAKRREKLEQQVAVLKAQQSDERQAGLAEQKQQRLVLKSAYRAEMRQRRIVRNRNKPRGLAAFLGRITGVELITRKVYKYRDRKRFEAFLEAKQQLKDRQAQEGRELQRRQEMQALDLQRKVRALAQIEQRELKSLETALRREQRMMQRARYEHMPALNLTLTPRGRRAVPHKAMQRYTSELVRELRQEAQARFKAEQKEIKLSEDFAEAAGTGESGSQIAGGSGKVPETTKEGRVRRSRRRKQINLSKDFEKAAKREHASGDSGRATSDGPKLASERKVRRSRRRRDRDLDRGRWPICCRPASPATAVVDIARLHVEAI
jgi:hypothetical protein